MLPGVCFSIPATPSLPLPPNPRGQLTDVLLPTLLFHSLLSEQAARFLSMDNSTRSAEGLLEINKLHYNKLRQAKITKELTELTGGF